MAREYWPCFFSYEEKCKKLSDQELGRLFRALMHYASTGEATGLAGRESIAFDFIADDISRAQDKYEDTCRKRAENGSKGGLAKVANATFANQNGQSKDKDEEEDKGKVKVKRFIPPTVDEVRAYCEARGNNVDPQKFVDYYSSNGWRVGRNPMRDWKAAVRSTWEKDERSSPKREKDFADLWREMDD